jgi:Leucine-rich repeat (LRR) protein
MLTESRFPTRRRSLDQDCIFSPRRRLVPMRWVKTLSLSAYNLDMRYSPKQRRYSFPRFRFRLRTLLVVWIGLGAWLGWWIVCARQQREAVANIQQLSTEVFIDYSYQLAENDPLYWRPRSDPAAVSWVPGFALDGLGVDYFHNVVSVNVLRGRSGKELELAAHLTRLRGLRQLVLVYVDATDAMVARLVEIRGLTGLELGGESLTDEALRMISHLPNLQLLEIRGKFTDAGLAHLKRMRTLRSLSIESPEITDAGLAHLARLTQLEVLALSSKHITGTGLAELAACKGLTHFSLMHSAITDDDLRGFAALKSLDSLNLTNARMTGVGFEHLSGLVNLKTLYLTNNPVTDDAIVFLTRLPNLEKLDLSDTQVTVAGLMQLKELPKLRRLVVNRPSAGFFLDVFGGSKDLLPSDLKRLQLAMPSCKIDAYRDF